MPAGLAEREGHAEQLQFPDVLMKRSGPQAHEAMPILLQ